jgi:hypothetical protein
MPNKNPTEITDTLTDINPEDTVFETETGRIVKIRTNLVLKNPTRLVFELTGSVCGEDGKALEPYFIAPQPPYQAVIMTTEGQTVDLTRELGFQKRTVVDLVERAWDAHDQLDLTPERFGVRLREEV